MWALGLPKEHLVRSLRHLRELEGNLANQRDTWVNKKGSKINYRYGYVGLLKKYLGNQAGMWADKLSILIIKRHIGISNMPLIELDS